MKAIRVFVMILLACVVGAPGVPAQDKANSTSKTPAATLKLQVTVIEREGDKKVANLPYTFFVMADNPGPNSPWTKLRTGSRIPAFGGSEYAYIDVGTNIDARGYTAEDGRYDIALNLERSWVAGEVDITVGKPAPGGPETPAHFKQPIIRQFKTELTFPLRDGQTTEITQSADPTTGRVLSITVTMNVVK